MTATTTSSSDSGARADVASHVALWRNVNVGQRGHPSAAELLAALAAAGAPDAVSVQSNGTILFSARPAEVDGLVRDAVAALARAAGHARELFAMPLETLQPVVDEHGSALDAHRRELTLHGGGVLPPDAPALLEAERRGRCTVIDAGRGWVVTLNHRDRQSNGTPVVEHVLGVPATSRSFATLARVCAVAAGGA
jgi:uncharacterized protein (DUF1697 family)